MAMRVAVFEAKPGASGVRTTCMVRPASDAPGLALQGDEPTLIPWCGDAVAIPHHPADWCTIALRVLFLMEVPDATNAPRVALSDGADRPGPAPDRRAGRAA